MRQMPALLFEIGCEELPAGACREARGQLPALVQSKLGVDPSRVLISPRRIAFLVDELPDLSEPVWLKGPPTNAPPQAREGFARRHGVSPDDLVERDGFLGALVAPEAPRGAPCIDCPGDRVRQDDGLACGRHPFPAADQVAPGQARQ
jgi:glycyl-tRNA synthetase beta chain